VSDVYDAAVAAADAEVAALLDSMRGRGLLDRTVVAIVSDHGEELGEHGGLLHGRTLYEEMLRVPFLLRVPGVAPAVVDAPVDLTDLAPTLRQAAGLAAEPRCDGRSVLDRLRDDGFAESFWAEVTAPGLSRRYALRSGRFKLIDVPDSAFEEPEYARRRPPELELFDLAADRGERANLVLLDAVGASGRPGVRPDPEQPAALAGMRRALAQRRAELDARRAELLPDARALEYLAGGDALRLLRELGYAAGAGATSEDE
jgi:arylsulfatase A-like enzyme